MKLQPCESQARAAWAETDSAQNAAASRGGSSMRMSSELIMSEYALSPLDGGLRAFGSKPGFATMSVVDFHSALLQKGETGGMNRRVPKSPIDRIVVINDLSIARGGGTGLALLSVRLFRQLGIPVTYICGDRGVNAELAALGVETVALGGEHILTGDRGQAFLTGLHNTAARTMIERWLDEHDTGRTVYHVHGWSKIMSPAIFLALSRVADRTVLHAHDFFLACPNGAFHHYPSQTPCDCRPLSLGCVASRCDKRSYAHKLWRLGRSARLRSILSQEKAPSRLILLLHEKMAPGFEKSGYPTEVLHTLRNPVTPYTSERVRAEDNSDFFFIGRLEPEKGIGDAVKAAAEAGVRLTIIGDGPLKESLRQFGANVSVLGWQNHAEIASRIRAARALLMPTRYCEPFGLVAVEASQSGIPVILSDKAYLADEMVAAGVAIACDTSKPAAFASALKLLAEMPQDDIRAMSERAYGRAARLSTTPEEWRDALIGHYQSLLTGASE